MTKSKERGSCGVGRSEKRVLSIVFVRHFENENLRSTCVECIPCKSGVKSEMMATDRRS